LELAGTGATNVLRLMARCSQAGELGDNDQLRRPRWDDNNKTK
jgi:hypothetical protein